MVVGGMTVAATAAGAVLVTAPAASATDDHSYVAPVKRDGGGTSFPASGTGGLIIRDVHGNDLGSGIGEQQAFQFLECGPAGSGLVKVHQLTRGGGGGWGNLYGGYVRHQYTQLPSMFPCD